jgi:Kae1-associated kinase Bud32
MKLIGDGAEARIYLDDGKNQVVKKRIKKGYRIKFIDSKLRLRRTRREAKILAKLGNLCPGLIDVNNSSCEIVMDYVKGNLVKDLLESVNKSERENIMYLVGINIGKMHEVNVIHGDLTTSNMVFDGKEAKLIDFGLSMVTTKTEHKAVDLHLLKQALESKHHKNYSSLFNSFLIGYKNSNPMWEEILSRLEKVEKRGRYKRRVGG